MVEIDIGAFVETMMLRLLARCVEEIMYVRKAGILSDALKE